jgi:transposase-like protein
VREITNKTFNYSKWRNSEKNIYRLDSLVIKVNGEEFYRADAINFTFKEGKLVWSDRNLGLNLAFRHLMRRSDCPAPK